MKIYLASPYTHSSEKIRESRFDDAARAAGKLVSAGYMVYSPICHSHPICVRGALPPEYEFWKKLDYTFLEWCDIVVVLKLYGWEVSVGVADEVATAIKLLKPSVYWELGAPVESLRLEDLRNDRSP